MRQGALMLMLVVVPLAASLPIGDASAAASGRGQIGATSRASIAISVSVRPQVRLSNAPSHDESRQTATTALASPRDICLLAGSGNYSLLVQSRDGAPDDEHPAALAESDSATSVCRSAAGPGATSTGFRLPPDKQADSYMLLIAPE